MHIWKTYRLTVKRYCKAIRIALKWGMMTELQPHQARIQKVGKVLWGFSWFWLIFNLLALLIVGVLTILLGVAGFGEEFLKAIIQPDLVPGLDGEAHRKILEWDYAAYQDHFWLTLFYIVVATMVFLVTMVLILKIAAAWKRGDVFGNSPIRCFRILGWIYLIHGIIGQLWGMTAQFVGNTHTAELIYFSFIRDVNLMGFSTSGTGIEWGLLCLTLSWILEHARLMRDEQELTV